MREYVNCCFGIDDEPIVKRGRQWTAESERGEDRSALFPVEIGAGVRKSLELDHEHWYQFEFTDFYTSNLILIHIL
jgi:hypothetical protein